ncbi:retrovirus-related pol polyprotein from transposon TNT 1-94 [Tanacetum coccineum]
MQNDVQHNYVVDSDADYTSDSNIIPYDQYVEDNEEHVVQSNVSSVRNDALMSILDEMHEQGVQKRKIDEQMRIIISDRNRKETSLKYKLHSAQLQLCSTLNHHKTLREEATILKKDFKQKEDKFLEEFLDIKRLKDKVEDRLFKQDQSVQTVHMLCRPKPFYDEKNKVAIGYKNPLCLTRAKQVQSALYNGNEIVRTNHAPVVVHDSEDTLEIAEITRKRMMEKMKSPLCVENKVRIAPPDYSKENLLATFAPQRNLTPEQIFWSIDENDRKKAETSVPKPLSALIVYPPNTPVKLVPRVLPTKSQVKINLYVIQVILWYLDSGCSKYMTGNCSKLKNFVEKFIGAVRFGNDHFEAIIGYGDYVIGDNVISRVYYVEGLGHNLFFVGQFCDSDLEVALRKHSCFVRDINGADLLKGSHRTNLYTISIDDMMKSSPICLLSKASKSKSWLWHRRLNHLNFGTINDLARKDLVRVLLRLKFEKDHLCSACQLGKSKKFSHKPKSENTNIEYASYPYHMDQCGVGIFNQKSVPRTPQQNGIVERRNRTLMEAARTMLIFSKAQMFLWVEAVATACYAQNRSLIHTRHNKTPYELVHDKKPDLTFLRVFGALCYPTNDSEDLGKFQAKADIGIFVGSGPEHIIMTPGQINSGLAPSHVPATTYIPPTDKDLEILFQPMFDEYFDQSTDNAPSSSHSLSSSQVHPLVFPQGVAAGPTIKDTSITQADLHPPVNPVAGEPSSAQSTSGDVSLAEPNQVTQPPDHLRR